ncbi:MAG TPA: carbohydrate-binding protein, partial [Armatimonadota bacterium]|nr:carbohydrate-binding protein [Armatimonadota bacterium]
GVVLIEAEDFVGEGGGGPVQVSEGEHIDQHGGASIYSFGVGQRHWVEWTCGIDAAGTYDLYARTATQEEAALRTLDVDGKPAGFVSFPGTGGWAREDPEQWAWTRVAADLDLAVGKHSIRLTTEGAKHLNVDVLALVPVD